MCTPTAGSPTITLCQLRPNHYIVYRFLVYFFIVPEVHYLGIDP